ncbi:MAG TPA: serine--tRNA ligase [Thermoleophilia bacterium]|nr:serine--tRNA ligase [Thermoleophilia bacterium]HQG03398.1 serine--tRNA ligase [Thermoleophilia bacterium]HQG54453.1 serine--tRNA ligase [Thermoleophilia bacterium]HQJ97707.1 serine--tRNA ligase [Thermoleophilia bacterium]
MLDIKLIRSNPELVRASLQRRGSTQSLDEFLAVEAERRRLTTEVEAMRARRKSASDEIARVKKAGGDAAEAIAAMRALGETIKERERALDEIESRLRAMLLEIPNLVLDDVPPGGEDDAVELRRIGEPPSFDFAPKDHLDLGTALDLIDMERAAKASGSRFAYLKGDLVTLQFALVRLGLEIVAGRGFRPVVPPVLVREEAMYGTGFLPTDEQQIYRTTDGDCLVGTSEVPLAAMHMDEFLEAERLPLRYAGYSTCFRREAGAAGKDTRGILRVHQFDKLEMFSFCLPEQAEAEHALILSVQEEILRLLGIPYRVVNIAAGDLGAPAAKKYDCEAWLPGQGRYREVTSCSNCTDYQARRLNCRYRTDKGPRFVYTLNGTCIAIGRTIIAIMENYQRADGSIAVPEALRPYMGKETLGS